MVTKNSLINNYIKIFRITPKTEEQESKTAPTKEKIGVRTRSQAKKEN